MSDITARIADPDDLRVLIMLAALLIVGLLAAVAAGSQPFMHRQDAGSGFRWVKRQ